MSQHYKGRIIDPRAYELADGTGWSAQVNVAEDIDSETIDTPFSLREKFHTREAALEAALAVGKRQVEKRIESSAIRTFSMRQTSSLQIVGIRLALMWISA